MAILNMGYSYKDLTIIPAEISKIKSRSEINPFTKNGNLPIFTAPMSSVVDVENFKLWEKNNIIPIMPRNITIDIRLKYMLDEKWVALSLKEFEDNILNEENGIDKNGKYKVLIDLANGHMSILLEYIKKAKSIYHNIEIMVGNIANPKTYEIFCEAGADFIRCSIGSGSACITASNTGIHYPIASLINKINIIKQKRISQNKFCTKIIADGGVTNFSDVIKALALGADYVMIGGIFAGFLESAAHIIDGINYVDRHLESNSHIIENIKLANPTIDIRHKIIIEYAYGSINVYNKYKEKYKNSPGVEFIIGNILDDNYNYGHVQCYVVIDTNNPDLEEYIKRYMVEKYGYKKEFFGMSTKKAQTLIDNIKSQKTSEGITKIVPVVYTIKQWRDNMESYLRSAMSYSDALTLQEFIGVPDLIINSFGEISSVNK